MDRAFNKFGCLAYFKETIDFIWIHFQYEQMALSMYHVDFNFIKKDFSLHSFLHPTTSKRKLVSFLLNKDILALLFVLLHKDHKFSVILYIFEVIFSWLLDIIIHSMYFFSFEVFIR